MKHNELSQGSLSVYFILSFLPMLALTLALLHAARFQVEENDTARICRLSGEAAFSCHDENLASEYGLFGTSLSGLKDRMTFFVSENLQTPSDHVSQQPLFLISPVSIWKGLFAYTLDDIVVKDPVTLQNTEALSQQIHNYMRFRIIQEIYVLLKENLDLLKDHASQAGLRGKYMAFQDALLDHNSAYARLIDALYPADMHKVIYGVMTAQADYDPMTLYRAVQDFAGYFEDPRQVPDDAIACLSAWEPVFSELAEVNGQAFEAIEELKTTSAALQQRISDFNDCVQGLSASEKSLETTQDMIRDVAEKQASLWGLHGEISSLEPTIQKNMQAAEAINEKIAPLYKKYMWEEVITQTDYQQALSAAKSFISYDSSISLDYDVVAGERGFSLSRFWKWIDQWRVDLKDYAENKDLFEDPIKSANIKGDDTQELISSSMAMIEEESADLLDTFGSKIELTEYAFHVFHSLTDRIEPRPDSDPEKAFFKYEIEFLLHGSSNEYKNLQAIELEIIGIRSIFNMLFLTTNPEKRAVLENLSAKTGGIIAPGIGNLVAYGAMLLLWTAAESYIDFAHLIHGDKVPLMKTADSWSTDLNGILERKNSSMDTDNVSSTGLDYEMYLRLLCMFRDPQTLLSRIQTVISLTMQKQEPAFSLSDMVVSCQVLLTLAGHSGKHSAIQTVNYAS